MDLRKLGLLTGGSLKNVSLTANTPVVLSIKVGAGETELTQATLDKLILMASAAAADGTYDSRYYQQTELNSTTNGEGASLIGVEAIAGLSGANVQAVLSELKTLIDATNFLAMKESQTLAFLISRHSFSDFLESMECRLTSISIEFFLPQTSSVFVSFFLIASPAIFSVLLFFFIPLSFFASQAFPAP